MQQFRFVSVCANERLVGTSASGRAKDEIPQAELNFECSQHQTTQKKQRNKKGGGGGET